MEYTIEYAKSSRSACAKCKATINKDEVRIGKMVQSTTFDGLLPAWHHVACIAPDMRIAAISQLKGIAKIRPNDAATLAIQLTSSGDDATDIKSVDPSAENALSDSPTKKRKVVTATLPVTPVVPIEVSDRIQEEIRIRWRLRDALVESCKVASLKSLAEQTKISPTGNQDEWIFKLIDRLLYGKEAACPVCHSDDTLIYSETKAAYVCHGNLDAWSRCTFEATQVAHVQRSAGYLQNLLPLLPKDAAQLLQSTTLRQRPYTAYQQVVKLCPPIEVVESQAAASSGSGVDGADDAYGADDTDKSAVSSTEEVGGKKRKMLIKAGGAVEESSGLDATTHIHCQAGRPSGAYSATLSMSDVTSGHNSFYVLQLLKDDAGPNFYLFRRWGRIGTSIGGNTKKEYKDETKAVQDFCNVFRDKTGNSWSQGIRTGAGFRKVPGKFSLVETDYTDLKATTACKKSESNGTSASAAIDLTAEGAAEASSVPERVQKLISHWFDIEQLEVALQELEIDTQKMPLGKLSRASLQRSFDILNAIEHLINTGETKDSAFVSLTNQFLTLVPQTFPATGKLPVIKTKEQVTVKTELVQTLLDMEVTSRLLETTASDAMMDPFLERYKQLNTSITPLDKASATWDMIDTYVKNTHPDSQSYGCKLRLEDVYELSLPGQAEKFAPHAKDTNRQLLFHATRHTNMVSILSSGGLKIAPKNAPISGCRVGKGLYYTGTLAKSACYTFCSPSSNIGYVFLAEVALGRQHQITRDQYFDRAPVGFQSVHAVGTRTTNPTQTITLSDGCKVPTGKLTSRPISSSFGDDEFVVYQESQNRLRYLLRVRFDY